MVINSNNNKGTTGSAVFLLHCLQNIHTSRIVGISLHPESGLLAIADSSGKCTIKTLHCSVHNSLPSAAVYEIDRSVESKFKN